MPRDPHHDILFEPIQIGPKLMRNRFYATPHATGFGTVFPGAEAYYRAIRAEGGWGAITTGHTGISMEGDEAPWLLHRLVDEGDVRNLALLCDKVHEQGALAGVELAYPGVGHTGFTTRLPGRGVSQLRGNEWTETSCYELTKADIRELQLEYVAAARRARQAGFDLIALHHREAGGIGYQFLMPYWNKRTDEYGGSFENRSRFSRELFEVVREAVGDDCAIVGGFCVDTREYGMGDGIRVDEDGISFIAALDHLVDLWDVQVDTWTDDAGPSRFFRQNWQRPWVERIRPHTVKPIVGVGRFTNPDVMVTAIRSGHLDIIGAARPSIADPFLPQKINEGRTDDIRECIGCNLCVSRVNLGRGRIICTQNATVGEEYRRAWHPEKFVLPRNAASSALIVGAGPAGMECATILGRRGMSAVHLVEAEEQIGGILRWIPRFRGLQEWSRVAEYRRTQLAKLPNVSVVTDRTLDEQAILGYGANIVIIAVGAEWDATGVNNITHRPIAGAGAGQPHVFTPTDIMIGDRDVIGDNVLIFDSDGYFMGPSLAEKLAIEGKRVTLMTPASDISGYMSYTGEASHMISTLMELNVEIIPNHLLTAIEPGHATAIHMYAANRVLNLEVDSTVLVTQRLSRTALYNRLMSKQAEFGAVAIDGVYRIGDCLEPRVIADVIFDGHRLAREIDTENPAKPLPFIREHRIVGSTDMTYDAPLLGREFFTPSIQGTGVHVGSLSDTTEQAGAS